MPDTPRNNTPSDGYDCGYNVVTLIDLLGQTKLLTAWDYIPDSYPDPSPEWLAAMKGSTGVVEDFRKSFTDLFKDFKDTFEAQAMALSQGQPPDKIQVYNDFRRSKIRSHYFSDTMVFYSTLVNESKYLQVRDLLTMIVTAGNMLLASLSKKLVFRGALEVGMLTHLQQGDPYGPALAKAYHLESHCAHFPRILVGEGAIKYITDICKITGSEPATEVNRWLANTCKSVLSQDTKGSWFVDYLGNNFTNLGADSALSRSLQTQAFDFVRQALSGFKEAKDAKLIGYYEQLVAYFESSNHSQDRT